MSYQQPASTVLQNRYQIVNLGVQDCYFDLLIWVETEQSKPNGLKLEAMAPTREQSVSAEAIRPGNHVAPA